MTRVDFYFIGLVFSHWKGRKKETERNSSAKNGRGSRYKTSKQLHCYGIWMYTKGGISIQSAMSHKILRGSQEEACRLAWVESRLLSSQQRLTPGWQGLCTFPGETGSPWRLGGGLTPICSILSEHTVTAGGQLEFCGSRERVMPRKICRRQAGGAGKRTRHNQQVSLWIRGKMKDRQDDAENVCLKTMQRVSWHYE